MACTVQSGTKTATTTSNFAQVFGTETIQTVEQSLKFMRKFTAVGISSILYIRTDLPDDSFALKELDGVRVSMLTTRNPVAKKICDGIQNGMNALKDGYLKELAVVFVKKDTDDIVETHSFKYILPNEIKKSKKNSAESDADVDHLVKIATRKLMHNMSSNLQICDGLPNGTQMLIRLQYTPETPEDYNPTGYVSLSPNSGLLKFPGEEEPVRQSFGTIDAKFYKVKLQMQSELFAVEELSQKQNEIRNQTLNETKVSSVYGSTRKDNDETMMSPILGSNNIDRDETMISPISKINAGDANMGDDSASTMISLSTNLDADAGSFEMSDLAQETKKIGRKTRSTSRKENNKKSKFEEGGVKKTIAKAPRKKQQLYSIPKSPFLTMDQ